MSVELKIEVTQSGQKNVEQPKNTETKKDTATIEKTAQNEALKVNVLTSLARRTGSYVTSRIGYWTGNNQLQADLGAMSGIVSAGMAIAANPVMGIALTAFSLATKAIDYAIEVKWENRSVAEYRRRSGNYLGDKSRGENS